ncbi:MULTISPECIES: UDP-N-acetylglucosamine 2-epimerase [unclassified Agarivorans]|uniref:UDP-N-acetylglucosamine 2-epimerase n=1 Tax=unclassified Agarivorans TaxID=2636026 RepID=UPI0026E17040|nr:MULTISPECIES: UDP-N-acetylglucosamine 2-epimerase [unclassified Agarivorans]MDO6686272.1 UDP-N-acetylglucosamine 2-epimerase [Agarivorans sp. 3_MG-2023]MDO6716279.1 UDP-N-acetylglucosamine 2-epimerase [Agarivorans sp. 2_MG-2023]
MKTKIKVCVVVASRANYGRVKYLLKAIKENVDLELQIIVGASLLIDRYGKAVNVIKEDGFVPNKEIYYIVEGENLLTQAKSTGLGVIELSTALEQLDPDFVVSVADRYETMATAIASTYLNIPLIHIQGGEVSGNIDDRVRHAISKLADFHFVATEQSKVRLIKMGEMPSSVFNFGCPAMDVIAHAEKSISNQDMSKYGGVGVDVDWERPYILMIQHPVTTSYGNGFYQVNETLKALKKFQEYQKIVLWPNSDAGGEDVSKGIRTFREKHMEDNFHFYKNFSAEDFIRVLNNAACAVGNSSSFLREGAFLGTPSVAVGDRQNKREHGKNVIFTDYDEANIIDCISKQLGHGKYESSDVFGIGNAGKLISNQILSLTPSLLKPITY